MRPIPIPLVNGINNAQGRASEEQTGKVVDAKNLHIRPKNPGFTDFGGVNQLSLRPSLRHESVPALSDDGRLCLTGGQATIVEPTFFARRRNSDYGTHEENTIKPLCWSADHVAEYTSRLSWPISSTAYAQQTNGDSITLVCYKDSSSGWAVYYQVVADGRRYPEQLLRFCSAPPRACIFPNVSGTGYTAMLNAVNSVGIEFIRFDDNAATLQTGYAMPGDVLFDAVSDSSTYIYYVYTLAGKLFLRAITIATGVAYPTPAAIRATKSNPTFAGVVRLSTSVCVWSGGYTADSDTLYYNADASPIGNTTLTDRWSLASVLSPSAATTLVCGGGFDMATSIPGVLGPRCWCYVTNGSGTTIPTLGRVFEADQGTVLNNAYTAPILASSRLWTSPTFYGARVWGTMGTVVGCWELRPYSVATTVLPRCMPVYYQSVVNGGISPTVDAIEGFRNFPIHVDGDTSTGVLIGRDSASVSAITLGLSEEMRGRTVNGYGFDLLMSAAPRYWDGVRFVPAGLPQAPGFTAVASGAGGTIPAGNYTYAVVWEWTDSAGNRQQSPAQLKTVVVAAANTVTLTISSSSMPADERLLGNVCEVVGVVYRGTAIGNLRRGALYVQILQSQLWAVETYSVTDTGAVSFDLGEPLYTTLGGANELQSTAMEEAYLAKPYAERFLTVSRARPYQLNYTKTLKVARGIEPNQDLYFRLPEPATALAVQDGNVYWFTAENCYAFTPQFADDTGNGGGGVDAIPLAAGIGCSSPQSVIELGDGVYFIGPRGVWRIPRGSGRPEFVGLEVERFFGIYPVCRGVAYNPKTSEIVWLQSRVNTLIGSDLHMLFIYNHVLNQWFRWELVDESLISGLPVGIVYTPADGKLRFGATEDGFGQSIFATGDYGADDTLPSGPVYPQFFSLELATMAPFVGPGEKFRADRIAFKLDEGFDYSVEIEESHDDGQNWSSITIDVPTGIGSVPLIYRFAQQVTEGVRVRLSNSLASPGPQKYSPSTFVGVTLYASPLGTARTRSSLYRG